MYVVRPVQSSDIPALEALAAVTPGVHTLPRTRAGIGHAVERSLAAFDAVPDHRGDASYFFVLESPQQQVLGTAIIAATAGSDGAYFCFRNDAIHQVSRDLGISHSVHALSLCSDLSDCSQLSGFYIRERERRQDEAELLSRARLLYAAVAPQRFSERFFAAMAGPVDADGRSPFWDALGRKFFRMDFDEAERLIEGARNRTLIVELMPPYPVYLPLLPQAAQQALGGVHAEGRLAYRMLADEGFEAGAYVDIFDGGCVLQAHRRALRSFAHGQPRRVGGHAGEVAPVVCLVATVRERGFRAVVARCGLRALSESVALAPEAMRRLDVVAGDPVLCVRLR